MAKSLDDRFEWMPLYLRRLMADAAAFSDAEFRGYLLLLAYQWEHGQLPADPDRCARVAQMTVLDRPWLEAHFPLTPTGECRLSPFYAAERIAAEAQYASAVSRARLAGQASAEKRRQRSGSTDVEPHVHPALNGKRNPESNPAFNSEFNSTSTPKAVAAAVAVEDRTTPDTVGEAASSSSEGEGLGEGTTRTAVQPRVQHELPYLVRCTIAVNQGLSRNESVGGKFMPMVASAQVGLVAWAEDRLPLDQVLLYLEQAASRFPSRRPGHVPRTLSYFDAGLREHLAAEEARALAARTPAPARPTADLPQLEPARRLPRLK